MSTFRKKPVEVEAIRVKDLFTEAMWPDWITEAVDGESLSVHLDGRHVVIDTLEGQMQGLYWDWIIRGVQGELYPCKPEIFEATYEPVFS